MDIFGWKWFRIGILAVYVLLLVVLVVETFAEDYTCNVSTTALEAATLREATGFTNEQLAAKMQNLAQRYVNDTLANANQDVIKAAVDFYNKSTVKVQQELLQAVTDVINKNPLENQK